MSSVTLDSAATIPRRRPAPQWVLTMGRALDFGRTRAGLVLVALVVLLAVLGPLFAPHSPTEFVGVPYGAPTDDALLGTDQLGRDVLTRVLHGGRSVLVLSLAATTLGVAVGAVVGLVAAYSRGWVDNILMRGMDLVMAFPPVVLALLVVSTIGPKIWLLLVTVAASHAPRVARTVRGAALEVVDRDFVRAAEALGESRARIVASELLPNVSSPLLVEASLRMTYSIGIIAALSFIGLGLQPPAADWGLMINENRSNLTIQPWPVVLPICLIGLLTIGINLVSDGLSRALVGIEREHKEES